MDARPLIQLSQVSKRYHKGRLQIPVLDALDLSVAAGEFICLMGPSGSGKTTLLNLISGLDRADSGELRVAGQAIGELRDAELTRWRARTVGFVFQSHNLLPRLTAAQNVEVPLLLQSGSREQRRRRVSAALDLVGLADRASHLPTELSGGQEQRVAIARAIVNEAPLLICDEPTGDLDRETADEILGLLSGLREQLGRTIVMVTHDPAAAQHADRVVHLAKGRVGPGQGRTLPGAQPAAAVGAAA